jgi:hypothetical protein
MSKELEKSLSIVRFVTKFKTKNPSTKSVTKSKNVPLYLPRILKFKKCTQFKPIPIKIKKAMQEVEIGGVQVKFPFEPYQVQKNYMAKVIECLENGKNGILESPTGLLFFYENKW